MATIENTVLLKEEKLRQLAQLIRNHEVNNLYYITFANLGDQLSYLRTCNDNVATVNTILDECNLVVAKYKDDVIRGPIAVQVFSYAEHCLNNALQLIRNYTLRKSYYDKMIDHHDQIFKAIEELDVSNQKDVTELTESIREFDESVISCMKLALNPYASAEFSRYLRNIGIGFNELVRSYQNKLGYTGKFEDLEIEQKLEVYGAIIEASGRLSVLATREGEIVKASSIISPRIKLAQFGSAAFFMYDVGSIIWSVYSSDYPITTALRESLVLAAKMGGSTIGELVGVAAATELTGLAASSMFVTAVGLATGFVGGFIFALAAGALFDLIFGSAGEAVLPTDGLIVYVAEMPNGHDLAKQIQ